MPEDAMPQESEVAEVVSSTYRLTGLDDPDTARTLELVLARAEGVERVRIDYLRALLFVEHAADTDPWKRVLAEAGGLGLGVTSPDHAGAATADASARAVKWTRVAAFGLGVWAMAWWTLSDHVGLVVADMAFAVVIIAACSVMWRRAAAGFAAGRLNSAALASLSIIGIAAMGRWGEGAVVALTVNLAAVAQLKVLQRYRAEDPPSAVDGSAITRGQQIGSSAFTVAVLVLMVVQLVMTLRTGEGIGTWEIDRALALLAAASPGVFLVAGRAPDPGRRAFLALEPPGTVAASLTFKLGLVLVAAYSFVNVWGVLLGDQMLLVFLAVNATRVRNASAIADTV